MRLYRRKAIEQKYLKELDAMYMTVYGDYLRGEYYSSQM